MSIFEDFLNFVHLSNEHVVHLFGSLSLNILNDVWSLAKLVEVFEHLNSFLDSRDMVECLSNDCGVDVLQLLHILLEHGTIVIVPLGDLNIQDVVFKVLDLIKVTFEHCLQRLETIRPILGLGTSKDGHFAAGSLESKLELSFADLLQLLAALDESLILSKDGTHVFHVPRLLVRVLLDPSLSLGADLSPLLAAVNTLIQVPHALLNIVTKHVFLVDLGAAPLNDLVADLGQKPLHPLLR